MLASTALMQDLYEGKNTRCHSDSQPLVQFIDEKKAAVLTNHTQTVIQPGNFDCPSPTAVKFPLLT